MVTARRQFGTKQFRYTCEQALVGLHVTCILLLLRLHASMWVK